METSRAGERAVALDALRGIALFGVLIVNLLTQFRVTCFEQLLAARELAGLALTRSRADEIVLRLVGVLLEGKASAVFSLLFGVGLAVQHERSGGRSIDFGRYAAHRLGFLLVLGLVHLFFVWDGDILTLYALLGVVTAVVVRLPVRVLVGVALLLLVVQVLPLPYPPPFASPEATLVHVAEARRVYGSGSFVEVARFRIHEVPHVAALLFFIVPRTLALFLLGASAWRAGLFRPEAARRRLVRVAAVLGFAASCAVGWSAMHPVNLGAWNDALYTWVAIVQALGYAALVVIGLAYARSARVLAVFAPLGRMALTSYLTQSVVLSLLFHGYGLGLMGRLGEARAAAIGVAFFAVQAVASALWLRRYRFGPVEWLWRSFTYRAWQPLARAALSSSSRTWRGRLRTSFCSRRSRSNTSCRRARPWASSPRR